MRTPGILLFQLLIRQVCTTTRTMILCSQSAQAVAPKEEQEGIAFGTIQQRAAASRTLEAIATLMLRLAATVRETKFRDKGPRVQIPETIPIARQYLILVPAHPAHHVGRRMAPRAQISALLRETGNRYKSPIPLSHPWHLQLTQLFVRQFTNKCKKG